MNDMTSYLKTLIDSTAENIKRVAENGMQDAREEEDWDKVKAYMELLDKVEGQLHRLKGIKHD